MYCPSCGKGNGIEQKFCRACGLNLEPSANSLREQRPTRPGADLQRQERALQKFGNVAMGGFGLVIGVAMLSFIYFIVTKMILSGTQPLAGILLVAFIIFAGLALTYVFLNESTKEKRQAIAKAPGRDLELPAMAHNALPETTSKLVPSVVEDTTELLDKVPRSRK